MKKLYLFLSLILIVFPAHAGGKKDLAKVTLDMFLDRGAVGVVQTPIISAVAKNVMTANIEKGVEPLVLKNFSAPSQVVSAAPVQNLVPQENIKGLASVATMPASNPYLMTDESIAGEILSCGQSFTGYPQDIYVRNIYSNNPIVKDLPTSIQRAIVPYVAALVEKEFPGTPNAEWIAENALYDVQGYIPSYMASFDALAEDESKLNATVSYLENVLELAYQHHPGLSFEGDFVRTYKKVEDLYFTGSLSRIGAGNIRQAMRDAHERGLQKDAGFFLIKVGKLGERNLQDVLILDASNLQWISFGQTFKKLPKMIGE